MSIKIFKKIEIKNNIFQDQERFMNACDQTTNEVNEKQFKMYCDLINEEVSELIEARNANDKIEMLDALIDIIIVAIGAGHSLGFDLSGAWNEVMKTNFAKIDPITDKVKKREDGKVLKPEGWQAPELENFLKKDNLKK